MPKLTSHWTERSLEDFLYKVAADFAQQIENYIEASGENQTAFAKKLGISPGRVSQILNAPGNLSLKKIIQYARAANKKVAIVAYDDNDPTNEKGPINSQVFEQCWMRHGRPSDFFALEESDAVSWYVLRPERPVVPFPPKSLSAVKGTYATYSYGVADTASTDAKPAMKTQPYFVGATTGG